MKQFTYIDLFAGAGGLSEGFIQQGFKPIAHVEMESHACNTLKTRLAFYYLKENKKESIYVDYLNEKLKRDDFLKNIPIEILDTVINTEISDNSIPEIFDKIDKLNNENKVDLIIGGPPCQAYSVIGRARDPKNMTEDPRNHLYKYYVQFLEKYKPKMFIFENVPGILSAKNGEFFEKIKEAINKAGYVLEWKILNAKDFGVLQDRKRVIIIGWEKEFNFEYPKFEKSELAGEILKDLFYDLPHLKQGQEIKPAKYTAPINDYLLKSNIRNGLEFTTQHVARPTNEQDYKIYETAIEMWVNEKKRLKYKELPEILQTHKNKESFQNRFQVVNHVGVSHTMVAHISCDGHYYIYPDLKQVRSISVREAARIQSFPDDFFFEGGRTAAFKQIGNAVPPLMANGIAKEIKKII